MDSLTFDRLVAQLSGKERKELLENLKPASHDAAALSLNMKFDGESSAGSDDIEKIFKSESLFFRLYIWIISLFQGLSFTEIYKAILFKRIARKIEKKFPGLIDWNKKILWTRFYTQLLALKKSADYFFANLKTVESGLGEFYVFLGTFFMPVISERYQREVNPFNFPFSTEDTNHLRVELSKKLDRILQSINHEKWKHLGHAIASLNWLREFCALPFHGFITKFAPSPGDTYHCRFVNALNYVDQFASVLCYGVSVEEEVLEALFCFNVKDLDFDGKDLGVEQADISNDAQAFILNASEKIKIIKTFMSDVPLRSIGILTHASLGWTPDMKDNSDDWFTKFKLTWHKVFEREWENWITAQQRERALTQMRSFTGLESFPLIPFRPWTDLFPKKEFHYELSMGFLLYTFKTNFAKYVDLLEHILMTASFPSRDYRSNLTDCMDDLMTQSRAIMRLSDSLRPFGTFGIQFTEITSSPSANPRKTATLMQKVEDEARGIAENCQKSSRKLANIVEDIIDHFTGSASGPAIAFSGENPEEFLKNMEDLRYTMATMYELLDKLENVTVSPDDKSIEYDTEL